MCAAAVAASIGGLLAAGCSSTAAAPHGSDSGGTRTATAPGTIYGVRTAADDRSLVVGYEDGGCAISGRPKLAETPSAVTVTAEVTSEVPGKGGGCPADSRPRTFIARLTNPLRHRLLVDGATLHRIIPFDGAGVLTATVTPAALSVRIDEVYPGTPDATPRYWIQLYHRATPAPSTQCTAGNSPSVSVAQGYGVGRLAGLDYLAPVPGHHSVGGVPAQLYYQTGVPRNNRLFDLRWEPAGRPGWAVLIQVQQECRPGYGLTATQLIQFANGLKKQ